VLFREATRGDLVALIDTGQAYGFPFWLEGGWGVDVLLGEQTRWHSDLDVIMETDVAKEFGRYLCNGKFELLLDEHPTPWSLSYGDVGRGKVVDIHVVELDEHGNAHCGPDRVYPAKSLTSRRRIDNRWQREVRLLTPKWQVHFHTGYETYEEDWHDVAALCARFKCKPPPEFEQYRARRARRPRWHGLPS
jgi:lincosamide nucleotidyltransferase A/C/D/E